MVWRNRMDDGFVTWSEREPPLIACAVAAWGDVAFRLGQRLLDLNDEALGRLSGVAGTNVMVLLGETEDLPWVDGVVYLGRDEMAPVLLLPTHQRPVVPPANLLDRVMLKRFPKLNLPLAILPETLSVISCHGALRLSRQRIEAWLAAGKP